ncbi:restriction endonuclease subunit S [uncultured Methanobrevibacter sp.]|uniref:restriction endonuclease subunit S n=1 Tax=uncultured Methanobrevibacter sp. TaxID=253161 RepID=UPI0025D174E9|nr:restriction endonuclease subunit S [uncultured Methanobrevibacter sp.]
MQQIFAQKLRFDYEDEWSYMAFDDIFKSISPKKFQIKSGEIQENGNFEVIDQGKNKIAGYYNDANKLFQELPVIIYGDHTTFVKYRKNPFIVGADGVKLLSSKIDANLKYLYYALQHFNIKPEGYKRHFSIIRKIKLPIPVLEEQEHISKLFTTIDSEIDFIKIQVEKTNEFKKGLLQQMFVYIYIRIKFLISVRIFLASNTF